MEGFKFNYTEKEKAVKQLQAEQQDKDSIVVYNNVMSELGLEVFQ